MKLIHVAVVAVLSVAPALGFAQAPASSTTTTSTAPRPTINQRKTDQQDRIANGVHSGQLTAGETSHLEHQETGINREEHGMRAQDNGHLTAQDRRTLRSQQNAESRRIYKDKHNDKVQK